VTAGRLNVRDAIWGNVLGQLVRDAEVVILAEEDGWFRIVVGNARGYGYVSKQFVSEK
jgi:hypothetical protein